MSQQYGKATVYGLDNATVLLIGVTIYGGAVISNTDADVSFTSVPLLNKDGDLIAVKTSNRMTTCTISMVPIGGSGLSNTIQIAKNSIQMPNDYGLVRLTYFPPALNGFWNFLSGNVKLIKNDYAVMSLNLVRYDSIPAQNLATVSYIT